MMYLCTKCNSYTGKLNYLRDKKMCKSCYAKMMTEKK